ncbi:hypothetical protein D3C80_1286160 [compost metagenome]
MRGEAANLLADPRWQVGVDDRGQPLARRDPRLTQQDIGTLGRGRQVDATLTVEQHRSSRIAPGDGRRTTVQIDAVQVGGHGLSRLDRRQGEDVELPRRQGHSPIREAQSSVFRLQLHRLGPDREADMTRHGAAVQAADHVVVSAPLHDDAGRVDGPLGRPPRLAHVRHQGRIHESPDRRVAIEDIVRRPPIAVARDLDARRGPRIPCPRRKRRGGAGGQGGGQNG